MKSLVEYILESRINESLSSDWLQKLMQSVKERGIKDVNPKKLIGGGAEIRWDKVTDEYCKEYNPGDTEALKTTRKIVKRDLCGLVLILKEDDQIYGTIANGGYVTLFTKPSWGDEWQKISRIVDRQYEAIDFVKNYKTVIYSFSKDNDPQKVIINSEDLDSVLQRNLSQRNMVLQGDAYYYKQLAKENVKRYKNIVAQNKSKKFNDELGKRVKDAVNRVMEISLDMEANPEKYKLTYKIDYLMELLYSKQTWDSKSYKSRGFNGLLPLWKSYLSDKTSAVTDDRYAEMHYKGAKNAQQAIEILLKKIEEQIVKIK